MFRFLIVLILLLGSLSSTAPVAAGDSYELDKAHSHIGFAVRHMAVATVRGEFQEYSANLVVDETDLANSAIELKIAAASIDTDNQQRDDHLRSGDFLEVETYPEIVFKSKQIEKGNEGRFEVAGDLTIHGVTREVVLDVEVAGPIKDPWGNHRLGIEGGITIDRQDYDVKWSNLMDNGGLVVADKVKVSFSLEATRLPE